LQATTTPPDDLFARQLQREEQQKRRSEDAQRTQQRRLREMGKESSLTHGAALYRATAGKLSEELKLRFEEAVINPEIARCYGAAYPYFDGFDSVDQVAAVALTAAVDLLTRRHRRPTFCQHIGKAIENESRLMRLRNRAPTLQRKLFQLGYSRRQMASKEVMRALSCDCPPWGNRARMMVGEFLLESIIKATGLFKVEKVRVGRTMPNFVLATPEAMAWARAVKPREARTAYAPMLVPPRPWEGLWNGGHLSNGDPLVHVHLHDLERQRETVQRLYGQADMKLLIGCANYLQSIPLQVSGEMAEVCRTAWDNGIDGLFPCRRVPPEIPERLGHDPDPEALKVRNRMASAAYRDQEKNRALRIRIERSIQAVEELAGETIWQAYHCDYRGRWYTANRHCTHQGADHEKAMVSFQPQPVNEEAIDWLFKAAAGHWGMSRDTWEARLQWGRKNKELMLAAAADPLGKLELWRSAKDPWQFLQLCRGYKEAMETGATGVPIRLDQTTSGLGILSALLRLDEIGRLCNLHGNTPRDLYTVIAERVTKTLAEHLELGDDRQKGLAQVWLEIGVGRGLVKGPVLAAPYGGSYQSLADAAADFLDEHLGYVSLEDYLYKIGTPSKYLASVIWAEMKPVIAPAMVVKQWLVKCVKKVMTDGKPMEWTAPSGLPMECAERMTTRIQVQTLLFGKRGKVSFAEAPVDGKLNHKAAARNISANYIHSFDAAMVAILTDAVSRTDMHVLTNHDCFCTTANRASELHNLLLSTFAGLYRTDWLEVHREEIQSRSGVRLPDAPERGELPVGLIGTNPYLFS